jgi:acyl carrier protein
LLHDNKEVVHLYDEEKAKDLLRRSFAKSMSIDPSSIADDSQMIADLNAKSVDYVHVVGALEDEYGFEVPLMQLRRRKTITDMAMYLEELYNA